MSKIYYNNGETGFEGRGTSWCLFNFKEDFRWGYSVTDVVTDNVILQEAQPIFTLFDKKKSLILFVNVTFFLTNLIF